MLTRFNEPLWGDEGFSAILSMKNSLFDVIKTVSHDTSPPLWYISEWSAFKIFGTSEIVIRGLAFFYYLIAIFFVYKIGTLLFNKKTGLIAAILTFLNPFFFIYAFEGRMYSIMAAGVAGSMYFFLKLLKGKSKAFWGYVLMTLWALYSHHFAFFVVFVQFLWFLYEFVFGNRKHTKTIFKAFLLVGIGYIPWLIPLYKQTTMVGGGFWLNIPSLNDLKNLFTKYLAEGINHKLSRIALYLVLITLVFRNWFKDIKNSLFLVSWFLVPILLTFVISQKFQSIFYDRYLLYAIPGAMLVLASKRRKISLFLIGAIILCFSIIDYNYFTNPTKKPFRELAAVVKREIQDGDFIINWNASSHHLWETKYYGIGGPLYIPENSELPFFVGTALMEEEDIISSLPNSKRIGVVTSGPVEEVVLPKYTQEEVKDFEGIKFIWYQKTNY